MRIGPVYLGNNRCEFTVWSPTSDKIELKLLNGEERIVPMKKDKSHYWTAIAENVPPGTLYYFRINGETERPDPASNYQPQDVHGPSEVVDHSSYRWNDEDWHGVSITNLVIYELHVGTFTGQGTFESVINRLDDLRNLGITAIELMPVAQFPGERNWGYDGVYPYAVQNSYGGPDGLKRLVDACHSRGMSVILDVVYNHFGPAGNYLHAYGPYFISKYKTPWGDAVNYDEAYSDGVRNYFFENALYWLNTYHIDALRLDAIHSIYDFSAKHFLEELSEKVKHLSKASGKKNYLILESDLNDVRIINPTEIGGYGCDAQWCDDFHHALHALLTGEHTGYYQDFGKTEDMVEALRSSFVYSGKYSRYRKRRHGNDASARPTYQFIVSTQNHDQIGNRAFGERLGSIIPFEAAKLAAGTMLLSPYIPMLFMGEEYIEEAPFQYFVSHTDPVLIEAVQNGRKEEFSSFQWQGEIPDPQSEMTFRNSKLHWEYRGQGKHGVMLEFYRNLISLRNELPVLKNFERHDIEVSGLEDEKVVFMHRWKRDDHLYCIMNFNDMETTVFAPLPEGNWEKVMDSSDRERMGRGSSVPEVINKKQDLTINEYSFVLFRLRKNK